MDSDLALANCLQKWIEEMDGLMDYVEGTDHTFFHLAMDRLQMRNQGYFNALQHSAPDMPQSWAHLKEKTRDVIGFLLGPQDDNAWAVLKERTREVIGVLLGSQGKNSVYKEPDYEDSECNGPNAMDSNLALAICLRKWIEEMDGLMDFVEGTDHTFFHLAMDRLQMRNPWYLNVIQTAAPDMPQSWSILKQVTLQCLGSQDENSVNEKSDDEDSEYGDANSEDFNDEGSLYDESEYEDCEEGDQGFDQQGPCNSPNASSEPQGPKHCPIQLDDETLARELQRLRLLQEIYAFQGNWPDKETLLRWSQGVQLFDTTLIGNQIIQKEFYQRFGQCYSQYWPDQEKPCLHYNETDKEGSNYEDPDEVNFNLDSLFNEENEEDSDYENPKKDSVNLGPHQQDGTNFKQDSHKQESLNLGPHQQEGTNFKQDSHKQEIHNFKQNYHKQETHSFN